MGINKKTPGDYGYTWCDDTGEGDLLSMGFLNNPVAFNHIDAIVTEKFAATFNNVSLLDIGFCLNHHTGHEKAEDLEAIGFYFAGDSTGKSSVAISNSLTIKQYIGCGEDLPLESNSFDFVCCGDLAANFLDFRKVLSKLSCVLKKDGIFFYDTMNRTFISTLIIHKIMRELKKTCLSDSMGEDIDMWIQPKDLLLLLDEHYLFHQGKCSAASTDFIFHYYNLRRRHKYPDGPIQKPYLNISRNSVAPHVNSLK